MCVYIFVCTTHICLYVETGQIEVVQYVCTDYRCLLVVEVLEGARFAILPLSILSPRLAPHKG